MVFLKVELKRDVAVPPDQLHHTGLLLRKNIILRLLDNITHLKASKEHGYYVAVTTLDSIAEGRIHDLTGEVVFPVSFSCTTVRPHKGEILHGTIDKVLKHGIFLKSGPLENIFLSAKMMKDYKFRMEEEAMFVNENLQSKMVRGSKVRYRVLGIKWIEWDRCFQMLATLAGDFLGPI
ncbi:DNA-directed RNA polymerase V subunit 7-like [Phalaenopsis equestris]|uniref:DNA-directed RNA polymerase V subunit 7-like n=1 Tax=Phalaenopsis equestris TaxID=78828 RepID=UPI0009E38131|nr:DNA-directed RNA polymerase V subunit 7-like [Phalaenopsis equestris]XP_020584926.1 DNA-directed RNA polymerase V subunit 7-like [Phalaenopsis equestris]